MSNTCSVSGHFSVQRQINYRSEWHLGFEEKSVFALKKSFSLHSANSRKKSFPFGFAQINFLLFCILVMGLT